MSGLFYGHGPVVIGGNRGGTCYHDLGPTTVNGEYFGGTKEDFVGTSFMGGMGEGDREFVDGFLTALTPESPVATAEPRVVRPGGEVAFHEWVNRGIFDADGRLVEVQSVGRDVTERRTAAEAERQQMLLVEVLRDTSAALNSTIDLDEVFDWSVDVDTQTFEPGLSSGLPSETLYWGYLVRIIGFSVRFGSEQVIYRGNVPWTDGQVVTQQRLVGRVLDLMGDGE